MCKGVKGKRVAIIGPSPSVRNEENGDFIEENYDIIVRINICNIMVIMIIKSNGYILKNYYKIKI